MTGSTARPETRKENAMTGSGDFNGRITDIADRDDLMSSAGQRASSSPAMVMVSRRVKPGHEGEYRRWVSRVIAEAEKFPSYLGATVLAPHPSGSDAFHHIHSFADKESLSIWLRSDVMYRLSREADAFSSFGLQQATGMEAWFSLPDAPQLPPPPKWKMAVATFIGAYIVTAIAIPLEMILVPRLWSFYETNIITNIIMATAMTWAIMPGMSRLLRGWLYGSRGSTPVPVPAVARPSRQSDGDQA
jgi:antibiotic biosynthesis monooxygenase (ABM) superfamily enzyme